MDYKQKSEEFRVSIRRRNLNEKMAVMRAKQSESYTLQNPQAMAERIGGLLASSNGNLLKLYERVGEVKMASGDKEVMSVLIPHFELFYLAILQIDALLAGRTAEEIERVFSDLATILINITSEKPINLEEVTTDVASPLLPNLDKPEREIGTLWLVANLLYRQNTLSAHFMAKLVKWGVVAYLRGRVNIAFASETEMTIYYYFVGAYAANLQALSFAEYRDALEVLEHLAATQVEELYWYLLDGLIEHASSFSAFKYEIFGTKILSKCDGYCKAKKSRFVIKYLDLVTRFLQGESQVLYKTPEEQRKKLLTEQYERLKNNNILKNLEFCLENRSPEVKRFLFENGYMMVALYTREISFIDEYFYLTLAEEVRAVERYEEGTVLVFLKYFRILLSSLLLEGSVTSNKEYTACFVKFVEETGLFDKLNSLIGQYSKSHELLSTCMDVVAFLLEYDIPSVNAALMQVKIVPTLEGLKIEGIEVSQKRDRLLDVLNKIAGGSREV